uniref:N-acetyltransferase domain-containing protein n=1 Tax=Bionectria ochroleuca TaxID=29856 RepID=A0A8H7NF80_BIOOC
MSSNLLLHAQFPSDEALGFLRAWLTKDSVDHLENPSQGILVARKEGTDETLGFVKWTVHREPEGEEAHEELPDSCRAVYVYSLTEEMDPEDVWVLVAIEEARKGHVRYLSVHESGICGPGVGSRLLRSVMSLAEAEGTAVVLESTMGAVAFYRKLGFEIMQGLDMMLPAIGSSDPTELYEERCMVWRSDKL